LNGGDASSPSLETFLLLADAPDVDAGSGLVKSEAKWPIFKAIAKTTDLTAKSASEK